MKYGKEVDVAILVQVREGDEKAFRMVYDMYSSRLYSFAYRFLKNAELSEEIVQETMIALWVTKERLEERYPMGSYLYTIARRLSLNMLRQLATSQTAYSKISQTALVCHNETENDIILSDLSCFAETMVTKLPAKQQEAFRLSRHHGLSHEQIAKRMQLSENTIKNHIVAALKNLRFQFKESDIFFFLLYVLIG